MQQSIEAQSHPACPPKCHGRSWSLLTAFGGPAPCCFDLSDVLPCLVKRPAAPDPRSYHRPRSVCAWQRGSALRPLFPPRAALGSVIWAEPGAQVHPDQHPLRAAAVPAAVAPSSHARLLLRVHQGRHAPVGAVLCGQPQGRPHQHPHPRLPAGGARRAEQVGALGDVLGPAGAVV